MNYKRKNPGAEVDSPTTSPNRTTYIVYVPNCTKRFIHFKRDTLCLQMKDSPIELKSIASAWMYSVSTDWIIPFICMYTHTYISMV